jgi:hypothetical protein
VQDGSLYTLPLRHDGGYFVKYQNILLSKTFDGVKYGEHQLDDIWRWVCWSQVNGHDSGTIHYMRRVRNPHYLKDGLGKAEYLSLAN